MPSVSIHDCPPDLQEIARLLADEWDTEPSTEPLLLGSIEAAPEGKRFAFRLRLLKTDGFTAEIEVQDRDQGPTPGRARISAATFSALFEQLARFDTSSLWQTGHESDRKDTGSNAAAASPSIPSEQSGSEVQSAFRAAFSGFLEEIERRKGHLST